MQLFSNNIFANLKLLNNILIIQKIFGKLINEFFCRYSLLISNTTVEQCSLPCQSDGIVPTFFSAHIRHYLRLWTGNFLKWLFAIPHFNHFRRMGRVLLYLHAVHHNHIPYRFAAFRVSRTGHTLRGPMLFVCVAYLHGWPGG